MCWHWAGYELPVHFNDWCLETALELHSLTAATELMDHSAVEHMWQLQINGQPISTDFSSSSMSCYIDVPRSEPGSVDKRS